MPPRLWTGHLIYRKARCSCLATFHCYLTAPAAFFCDLRRCNTILDANTYFSRLVCSFRGWLFTVEKLPKGPLTVSVERVESAPVEPCRSEEAVVLRRVILPEVLSYIQSWLAHGKHESQRRRRRRGLWSAGGCFRCKAHEHSTHAASKQAVSGRSVGPCVRVEDEQTGRDALASGWRCALSCRQAAERCLRCGQLRVCVRAYRFTHLHYPQQHQARLASSCGVGRDKRRD